MAHGLLLNSVFLSELLLLFLCPHGPSGSLFKPAPGPFDTSPSFLEYLLALGHSEGCQVWLVWPNWSQPFPPGALAPLSGNQELGIAVLIVTEVSLFLGPLQWTELENNLYVDTLPDFYLQV